MNFQPHEASHGDSQLLASRDLLSSQSLHHHSLDWSLFLIVHPLIIPIMVPFKMLSEIGNMLECIGLIA